MTVGDDASRGCNPTALCTSTTVTGRTIATRSIRALRAATADYCAYEVFMGRRPRPETVLQATRKRSGTT